MANSHEVCFGQMGPGRALIQFLGGGAVLNPTDPIRQIWEGEGVEMRKRGKNREQSLPCEILSFSFPINPSKSKTFWELVDESVPNVITRQLREEKMFSNPLGHQQHDRSG